MSIFKAYDIRGIYGQDLTEDDFYKIARAYAQFADLKGGKVFVARDCRKSSDSMFQAFAKGLVDEGVNVLDHIDCDARVFRKPVYGVPYLTEALPNVQLPTWSYHHPAVAEVRLEVLAAAASGAAGLTYFTGMAIDGERLNAISEGLAAVAKYEEFYRDGKRADATITLKGMTPELRHRVHVLGSRRLLTVFNCGREPATITLPGGQPLTIPPMDFAQREL